MAKKLRVGFDFDGVVAYNPLRVARLPVTIFKQTILRQKNPKFFIPRTRLQKLVWRIFHETSFFPATGLDLLRQLIKQEKIEAYLISGRFGYLESHLWDWLVRNDMQRSFKEIHVNSRDEQPHLFKERLLGKLKLNAYIEDNWDIVRHLNKKTTGTTIVWITNILDRFIVYPHKYTSLQAAVKKVIKEKKSA